MPMSYSAYGYASTECRQVDAHMSCQICRERISSGQIFIWGMLIYPQRSMQPCQPRHPAPGRVIRSIQECRLTRQYAGACMAHAQVGIDPLQGRPHGWSSSTPDRSPPDRDRGTAHRGIES